MIRIALPIGVIDDREKEICRWMAFAEGARFSKCFSYIEFEDEELASYFRLRFGV